MQVPPVEPIKINVSCISKVVKIFKQATYQIVTVGRRAKYCSNR